MEPKFVIQGVDYPLPNRGDLTMDEAEILYDRAKITLDMLDDDDVPFTPGLLAAMMVIAYMRGNPGVPRARAEKIIGGIALKEAAAHLAPAEDDADVPPSQTPTTDEPEKPGVSGPSSGGGSQNGSADSPDTDPAAIGTPVSDTPAISDPVTLAG